MGRISVEEENENHSNDGQAPNESNLFHKTPPC